MKISPPIASTSYIRGDSSHSYSSSPSEETEDYIQLVTEASQSVYDFEAKHQHKLAKVLCQQLRLAFSSKGSYMELFDSIY